MKCYFTFLFLLITLTLKAQNNRSALLPMPNHIEQKTGKPFQLAISKVSIATNDDALQFAATSLQALLKEQMQLDVPLHASSRTAAIHLRIDPSMAGAEHYTIRVDEKGLDICGATPAAVYYGVMTVGQLLLGDVVSTQSKQIAPVWIDDAPRFPFRALMLDPARHFLPVADVKFYIDQMARYKYNVLQLHLTDDQGWRFEVKKHPRLTGGEYYTQEQLKDLIAYAAERHIEIVPEIDIPGHTVAILAAYPELGCTHTDTLIKKVGTTVNLMLCANNEKVYMVFKDVIDEMAALFPSRFIHLGGDEAVVEQNWTKCTRCQALKEELGYEKSSQLMIPFFNKMLDFVRKNEKEPILWCELDRIYPPATDYLFPYPKDVTLVSWRGGLTPTCLDLTARHGNPVIMAPGEYAYLDYPQLKGDLPEFNNWGMPVTTLEKCYQFDPGYGKSEAEQAHVKGVMGTLWGEAMPDINRVTYMTYPRGLALAEAGWTRMEHRSWESFKNRLSPNLMYLMKKGVSVRVPFELYR